MKGIRELTGMMRRKIKGKMRRKIRGKMRRKNSRKKTKRKRRNKQLGLQRRLILTAQSKRDEQPVMGMTTRDLMRILRSVVARSKDSIHRQLARTTPKVSSLHTQIQYG